MKELKFSDIRYAMRVCTSNKDEGFGTVTSIYPSRFIVTWDDGDVITYSESGWVLFTEDLGYQETGVKIDVLKRDAEAIGIRIDDCTPYSLSVRCERAISNGNEECVVRQVFVWGTFYLTKTMDNAKAPILMEKCFKRHSDFEYYDVACDFMDFVELIK